VPITQTPLANTAVNSSATGIDMPSDAAIGQPSTASVNTTAMPYRSTQRLNASAPTVPPTGNIIATCAARTGSRWLMPSKIGNQFCRKCSASELSTNTIHNSGVTRRSSLPNNAATLARRACVSSSST